MITEFQIRHQLIRYLARGVTLNEFEDWLVAQSWNMHRDSSDAAQKLVGALELRFGEYSNGHLTDEALERELKGLISSNETIYANDVPLTEVSWTGKTVSESSHFEIELQAA